MKKSARERETRLLYQANLLTDRYIERWGVTDWSREELFDTYLKWAWDVYGAPPRPRRARGATFLRFWNTWAG